MRELRIIENRVHLNVVQRTVSCGVKDHGRLRVEFGRTVRRGLPAFRMAHVIARLQQEFAPRCTPTAWPGATEECIRILLDALGGGLHGASLTTYWNQFGYGRLKDCKRTRIFLEGEEVLAGVQLDFGELLFQKEDGHFYLGPRTRREGQYVYCLIELEGEDDRDTQRINRAVQDTRNSPAPGWIRTIEEDELVPGTRAIRSSTSPIEIDRHKSITSELAAADTPGHLARYLDAVSTGSHPSFLRADHRVCPVELRFNAPRLLQRSAGADSRRHTHDGGMRTYPPFGPIQRQSVASLCTRLQSAPRGQRICILGEPGAGKSVTLMEIARELAKETSEHRRGNKPVIPFYIPIDPRLLNENTSLITETGDAAKALDRTIIMNLCRQGKAAFLIDFPSGLPMGLRAQRNALEWLHHALRIEHSEGCHAVVAGPPSSVSWEVPTPFRNDVLAIDDMQPAHAERIMREYLIGNDQTLQETCNGVLYKCTAITAMTRNPLLLAHLCYAIEDASLPLPRSPAGVIGRVITRTLSRRNLNSRMSRDILSRLAWECWSSPNGYLSLRDTFTLIDEVLQAARTSGSVNHGLTPERLLIALRSTTLIESDDEICWVPGRLYLDWLAGCYLANQDDRVVGIRFISTSANLFLLGPMMFCMDRLWSRRRKLAADIIESLIRNALIAPTSYHAAIAFSRYIRAMGLPQDETQNRIAATLADRACDAWHAFLQGETCLFMRSFVNSAMIELASVVGRSDLLKRARSVHGRQAHRALVRLLPPEQVIRQV